MAGPCRALDLTLAPLAQGHGGTATWRVGDSENYIQGRRATEMAKTKGQTRGSTVRLRVRRLRKKVAENRASEALPASGQKKGEGGGGGGGTHTTHPPPHGPGASGRRELAATSRGGDQGKRAGEAREPGEGPRRGRATRPPSERTRSGRGSAKGGALGPAAGNIAPNARGSFAQPGSPGAAGPVALSAACRLPAQIARGLISVGGAQACWRGAMRACPRLSEGSV